MNIFLTVTTINAKETTTIMAIALAVVIIAGLVAMPSFTDQEADAQKKKKNGEKKSCKKNGGGGSGGGTGDSGGGTGDNGGGGTGD